MSAVDVLLRERRDLCDTLAEVGPDAPTLCAGWRTADLAAHLVARERRPDAGPGIIFGGPFARHTQQVMDRVKAGGYETMLATLRNGPPRWFRIGPLASANVVENWVHHEDVRRPNGHGPRPPAPDTDDILWASLRMSALIARRRVNRAGLVLRTPDGRRRAVKDAEPRVTITGAPGELVLFMTGRQDAADVTYDGEPDAVALVRAVKLGL
jgi:uncharacterized protein (TIGR03085 family)